MRWLLLLAALSLAGPALACGPDSDCLIGERSYRIRMPDPGGPARPGAIIFAHGFGGGPADAMEDEELTALVQRLGVALVAPKSAGRGWALPGTPSNVTETGAVEFAFFDALRERLVTVHGIDSERIIMSGFSGGGMLVWELACRRGGGYAAFVPMAGTFWEPVPKDCPGPAGALFHVHGTSDEVVPLAGRRIRDTKQGDVGQAMDLYLRHGGFGPAVSVPVGGLDCRRRVNPSGLILEFCLHPGGHTPVYAYLERVWREVAARR